MLVLLEADSGMYSGTVSHAKRLEHVHSFFGQQVQAGEKDKLATELGEPEKSPE